MADTNVVSLDQVDTERVAELLSRAGDARGGDVVDEAELARLFGRRSRDGWRAAVAQRGGDVVGYAAIVDREDRVGGDVVSLADADVLPALLDWQHEQVGERELVTWVRFSSPREMDAAGRAGFTVRRRLGVLGRSLEDVDVAAPPEGIGVRHVTNEDLDGVLAVLLDAYDGTDDGGWTRDELERRRAYPWYRDEDLLVAATDDNRIAGIHWTKRRDQKRGETYNLAIAPWAQGQGLGRALLTAGMQHLAEAGKSEIILWVDRANERAIALYDSVGFQTQWDDVALSLDHDGESDDEAVAEEVRDEDPEGSSEGEDSTSGDDTPDEPVEDAPVDLDEEDDVDEGEDPSTAES